MDYPKETKVKHVKAKAKTIILPRGFVRWYLELEKSPFDQGAKVMEIRDNSVDEVDEVLFPCFLSFSFLVVNNL